MFSPTLVGIFAASQSFLAMQKSLFAFCLRQHVAGRSHKFQGKNTVLFFYEKKQRFIKIYKNMSEIYKDIQYAIYIQNTKRQPARPKPRAAHGPARNPRGPWLGPGRLPLGILNYIVYRNIFKIYLDMSWYIFGIFVHKILKDIVRAVTISWDKFEKLRRRNVTMIYVLCSIGFSWFEIIVKLIFNWIVLHSIKWIYKFCNYCKLKRESMPKQVANQNGNCQSRWAKMA